MHFDLQARHSFLLHHHIASYRSSKCKLEKAEVLRNYHFLLLHHHPYNLLR